MIEFETHLDQKAAAGPPAFPTQALFWESVGTLLRRADAVKPLAEELQWLNIPWMTDFEEAERMARAERRPLFLWVSSHDPLGRCCGCAANLRAGPLSQDDVVRRVANFVPVALDRKVLLKEKVRTSPKSLQRQKPEYHGLWIDSPDGKVLAAHSESKAKDARLDPGDRRHPGDRPPILRSPSRPAGSGRWWDSAAPPGNGRHPTEASSLALHSRLMHKGARDGPVAFDTLTLEEKEWAPALRLPGWSSERNRPFRTPWPEAPEGSLLGP